MKHKLLLQILTVGLLVTALYVTPALTQWSANPDSNTAVCTATNNQADPAIASDGSGGAIITWVDGRPGNGGIYSQRLNASGVAQWTANGVPVCRMTADIVYMVIASDDSGGAIIAWDDGRENSGGNYKYDVFAQRVNGSGVRQWDTTGMWEYLYPTYSEVPDLPMNSIASDGSGGALLVLATNDMNRACHIGSDGIEQYSGLGVEFFPSGEFSGDAACIPTVVSDGSGGAIITWYHWHSGGYDIRAQYLDAAGDYQWDSSGVAICAATGSQYNPTIVSDSSGGAIITWHDERSGNDDIYAQRVNASGAVQWTTDGVAICETTGNQTYPKIAPDGSGGAVIVWTDTRNGNEDIFAQRVNASGAVLWTSAGVAICTETGNQEYPTLVSDGSGGAIITWYDNRSGNYDIYAQHVDAEGVTQWELGGVPICTATGDQYSSVIVSDGSGGAIITWEDWRNGTAADIYAQHVAADVPLPIQLASLTATMLTTGVQLEWTTISETNNYGFYVERKPQNGGAFATVSDLIPGANTSLEEHHYSWVDNTVTAGSYVYRLRQVDLNGAASYSQQVVVSVVLGVNDDPAPKKFQLLQNYPNPFNPSATIKFSVEHTEHATLIVFDMLGQEVARLFDGTAEPGHYYRLTFDGSRVGSGLYIYRIVTSSHTDVRKMVLLK